MLVSGSRHDHHSPRDHCAVRFCRYRARPGFVVL